MNLFQAKGARVQGDLNFARKCSLVKKEEETETREGGKEGISLLFVPYFQIEGRKPFCCGKQ